MFIAVLDCRVALLLAKTALLLDCHVAALLAKTVARELEAISLTHPGLLQQAIRLRERAIDDGERGDPGGYNSNSMAKIKHAPQAVIALSFRLSTRLCQWRADIECHLDGLDGIRCTRTEINRRRQ